MLNICFKLCYFFILKYFFGHCIYLITCDHISIALPYINILNQSFRTELIWKKLCVLIHIWTKGEVGAPWYRLKPSSKIFLLTITRQYFLCGSFMLLLSCFCYAFVRVCLLLHCGHLLGKGWPLHSRLLSLIVKLSLFHWYPSQVWSLIVSVPDLCPPYFDFVMSVYTSIFEKYYGIMTTLGSVFYLPTCFLHSFNKPRKIIMFNFCLIYTIALSSDQTGSLGKITVLRLL